VVLSIEDSSVVQGEDLLGTNNHVTIIGFNDNNSNMRLICEYSLNTVDCRLITKERTCNYFDIIGIAGTATVFVSVQRLQVQDFSHHGVRQVRPAESKKETTLWLWDWVLHEINTAMVSPMTRAIK
jgi:hypothetical protein